MVTPQHPTLITEFGKNDVLLGQGRGSYEAPGNVHLRVLVASLADEYCKEAQKKGDKAKVVRRVINIIQCMNPPGRFVEKASEFSSKWQLVTDKEKVEKSVSQKFRDYLKKTKKRRDPKGDEPAKPPAAPSTSTADLPLPNRGNPLQDIEWVPHPEPMQPVAVASPVSRFPSTNPRPDSMMSIPETEIESLGTFTASLDLGSTSGMSMATPHANSSMDYSFHGLRAAPPCPTSNNTASKVQQKTAALMSTAASTTEGLHSIGFSTSTKTVISEMTFMSIEEAGTTSIGKATKDSRRSVLSGDNSVFGDPNLQVLASDPKSISGFSGMLNSTTDSTITEQQQQPDATITSYDNHSDFFEDKSESKRDENIGKQHPMNGGFTRCEC